MEKKAQFRDVVFSGKTAHADFKKWLKQNTKWVLHLVDSGQDLQRMNIHESGEILDCDFFGRIYNGRFLNTKFLELDHPIIIWDKVEWKAMLGLVIESIEESKS